MPVPLKPMLSDWIERARAVPARHLSHQELFRARFGEGLTCRATGGPGSLDMDPAFFRVYEGIETHDRQRKQSEALNSRVQHSGQAVFGDRRENGPVCGVDLRKNVMPHETVIPMPSGAPATVSNRDLNPMWGRDLRQKINAGMERLPFQSVGNVQEQGGCARREAEKALVGAFAGFSISGHSMVDESAIHGLHTELAQASPGLQSIPAAIEACQPPRHGQQFPVYATHPVHAINQQSAPVLVGKSVGMDQCVNGMHPGQKGLVDDATTKLVLDAMMNQQQLIQAGLQACLQNTLTVQSHQNNMVAAILQTVAQSQATSTSSSPPNQLQALLQSLGAIAVQNAMSSTVGGLQQSSMSNNRPEQIPVRPQARDTPDDIPICYDFVQGKCSRRNCRYSHDTDRIIRHNSKEKGICFDHLRGECKRGAMCRFSHNLKDIMRRSHWIGESSHYPELDITFQSVCWQCEGSERSQDNGSVLSGLSSANSGKKWGKGICYDFVRGACSRGHNCPWSHDLMEIAVVTKRDNAPIGPAEQAQILFSTWGDAAESVDLVMDESTQSSDCQHGMHETTDDTDPESEPPELEPQEWQTVADDDSQLSIENENEILTVEALDWSQQHN